MRIFVMIVLVIVLGAVMVHSGLNEFQKGWDKGWDDRGQAIKAIREVQ